MASDRWPRVTPPQRRFMEKLERTRYKDIHVGSRDWQTALALAYRGFVVGSNGWWYSLTQRGEYWLRFGRRKLREARDGK